MIPTLFHLGRYPIMTHDFFVLLGVIAASIVFLHETRRRRVHTEKLSWVVLGALAGGAVGAKLSTVWRYVADVPHPSLYGVLVYGGKSILGGLAGAYIGALLAKRIVGYRESTGDLFAPAIALGMAVGRWGCFLTEQVGTPTSLPWGIRVSRELATRIPNCPQCASGVAMHPSFLYEIVFQAAMFVFLLWLRPRVHVKGELFKIYLISYAIFRFGVEFVRGNQEMWAGLTGPQLFLIPSTLLLAVYFWRQWSRGAYAASGARSQQVVGIDRANVPLRSPLRRSAWETVAALRGEFGRVSRRVLVALIVGGALVAIIVALVIGNIVSKPEPEPSPTGCSVIIA
jgi:phosphatidylglycerol---prolipoprotein diacylglyceryl transferase